MKLAFPILEDRGLESLINGHFGGTERFLVVDTSTGALETIVNPGGGHTHGACTPLAAFAARMPDGVCVAGIGAGAISRLSAAGVAVYKAVAGTVAPNVEAAKAGTLPLLSGDAACGGHAHGGGCGGHGHGH